MPQPTYNISDSCDVKLTYKPTEWVCGGMGKPEVGVDIYYSLGIYISKQWDSQFCVLEQCMINKKSPKAVNLNDVNK